MKSPNYPNPQIKTKDLFASSLQQASSADLILLPLLLHLQQQQHTPLSLSSLSLTITRAGSKFHHDRHDVRSH
jgi:hypothetical protein